MTATQTVTAAGADRSDGFRQRPGSLDTRYRLAPVEQEPATAASQRPAALIRRVNQLYHDLTQAMFDTEHRCRHRVERGFWRHTAELLSRPHQEQAGRMIVDLACGTGFVTRILGSALRPHDRMLAVDISPAALRTTRRKWERLPDAQPGQRPTLHTAVLDAAGLPLPDVSVDLFAVNAALHHLPEPEPVLREIDRTLKPGGCLALGFEPNVRHFRSAIGAVARKLDRLAWYASPRQNFRRFRARCLACPGALDMHQNVFSRINACLIDECLIARPLAAEAILDLVDPHTRGRTDSAFQGFDPACIIQNFFPAYRRVRLFSSDYLGESARRLVLIRTVADAALRAVLPGHGSLFSLILRKPQRAGGTHH